MRKERATLGDAFGAILGAITGTAQLLEDSVETVSKGVLIVDNIAETGVKKSDNFRRASALEDDANYLMDIVALIQSNPEVGQMYLEDESMLPEGISMEVMRSLIEQKPKTTNDIVRAVKQVSPESGRSTKRTTSKVQQVAEY